MTLPTYDLCISPLLKFLSTQPQGVKTSAAHEAVSQYLNLSEEQRQQLVPSGKQNVYKNRISWAHDRLKRSGHSSCPARGIWKITEEGLRLIKLYPTAIPDAIISAIANAYKKNDDQLDFDLNEVVAHDTQKTPQEKIGEAIQEIRSSLSTELNETIASKSDGFFEKLVLDLLHEMGYGQDQSDLERVGRSHDGGIDGVISLDKLGLEKLYVQAKKWKHQSSVGRPEIQAFYGALAGQKARRGVFITTAKFSQHAEDFAKSVEGIVLIDGAKLTQLMIDYSVGVSYKEHNKMLRLPSLDVDYFED